MLKNKKNILFTIFSLMIFFMGINSGLCAEDVTQHTPDLMQSISLNSTILKFLKVMGGVALSSIIIYVGLWFYNRFFVKPDIANPEEENNVLATPKNIDSAVSFFIKKNRM